MTAHDAEWDAGDLGCGDLVLKLKFRLAELQPGQVLLLTATDAGAPQDIPAWCRVTGNPLVEQAPAEHRYWIRRKG